ncbi:hypothetical protein [Methylobacterium sp. P5_C11]
MTSILTTVLDGAFWVADTVDDLLVEAARGFAAAAPMIGDPCPDLSASACGQDRAGVLAARS